MYWVLEGKRVNGLYMGLFPYSGTVTASRVKYGGEVQHTVALDEAIDVFEAPRAVILVGIDEITRILQEGE